MYRYGAGLTRARAPRCRGIDMFSDLCMWEDAKEFAKKHGLEVAPLIMKQAEWCMETGDFRGASDRCAGAGLRGGDVLAMRLRMRAGTWRLGTWTRRSRSTRSGGGSRSSRRHAAPALRARGRVCAGVLGVTRGCQIARKIDASERGLLASCAAVFRKASQFKHAEDVFKRIGDVDVRARTAAVAARRTAWRAPRRARELWHMHLSYGARIGEFRFVIRRAQGLMELYVAQKSWDDVFALAERNEGKFSAGVFLVRGGAPPPPAASITGPRARAAAVCRVADAAGPLGGGGRRLPPRGALGHVNEAPAAARAQRGRGAAVQGRELPLLPHGAGGIGARGVRRGGARAPGPLPRALAPRGGVLQLCVYQRGARQWRARVCVCAARARDERVAPRATVCGRAVLAHAAEHAVQHRALPPKLHHGGLAIQSVQGVHPADAGAAGARTRARAAMR